MKIRMTKSCWGSCSNKGAIQLNLRPTQTPKSCIEYVIIHELAHFQVHSRYGTYCGLLDRLMPDRQERREESNKIHVA